MASKIKIISDGTLTQIEVDGVCVHASAVIFRHVAGEDPRVVIELPCDELELRATDTLLIKRSGSGTAPTVPLPDEIMGSEQP